MERPPQQIDQLKKLCRRLSSLRETDVTVYVMEGLRLPAGCEPSACDALLWPTARDGYPTRLFLSVRPKSPFQPNWNGATRIGARNWEAYSRNGISPDLTLAQIVVAHLDGLVRDK
jgi:hypothetical protein